MLVSMGILATQQHVKEVQVSSHIPRGVFESLMKGDE